MINIFKKPIKRKSTIFSSWMLVIFLIVYMSVIVLEETVGFHKIKRILFFSRLKSFHISYQKLVKCVTLSLLQSIVKSRTSLKNFFPALTTYMPSAWLLKSTKIYQIWKHLD